MYQRTGKSIECYSDADWGGDQTNRKSYSGFVIKFADCPIAWESKKQTAVALSSTEAEYMALCTAAKEVIYQRNLIKEIGLEKLVQSPTKIIGDNISSQLLVKNPVYHSRIKHVDIW